MMKNKWTGIDTIAGPVVKGLGSLGLRSGVSAHAAAWDILESEVAVSTSVHLSVTLVSEALTSVLAAVLAISDVSH